MFGPNDIVFKEGERSNAVYYIQTGLVEILHYSTLTTFKEVGKQ